MPVHRWRRQREIQEVGREPARFVAASAEQSPLSMRLRGGRHVFDVRLPTAGEVAPVYGPYTRPLMPETMRVSTDWE